MTKTESEWPRIARVTEAYIPAMSTIGHLRGTDEEGRRVHFVGDHRAVKAVIDALERGEEPEAEFSGYQVVAYQGRYDGPWAAVVE